MSITRTSDVRVGQRQFFFLCPELHCLCPCSGCWNVLRCSQQRFICWWHLGFWLLVLSVGGPQVFRCYMVCEKRMMMWFKAVETTIKLILSYYFFFFCQTNVYKVMLNISVHHYSFHLSTLSWLLSMAHPGRVFQILAQPLISEKAASEAYKAH